MLAQLALVHRDQDWAPPRQIGVLRTEGVYVARVLDQSGMVRRLTIATGDLAPDGFYGMLNVVRYLADDPDLPVGQALVLPEGAFGCPAMIDSPPRGGLTSDPQMIADVIRALPPWADFADHTTARGFHTTSPSWSAAYRGLAYRWFQLARRTLVCLQPLADQLLTRIEVTDLEPTDGFAIVPGDLRVWSDGIEVTNVDGWHPCWCGDRLSALGPYLHLDGPELKPLLDALDIDVDAAMTRLQAYASGNALMMMAAAGTAIGAYERIHMLERARQAALRVSSLPERARGVSVEAPTDGTVLLSLMDRTLRSPPLARPWEWLACTATGLLAHRDPQWQPVAEHYLKLLDPGGCPTVPLPAPPGEGFIPELLDWITDRLVEATGGAPEGMAESLIVLGTHPISSDALAQLRDAWVAAALDLHDADTLMERWEEFDYIGWVGAPSLEEWLAHYADPQMHQDLRHPLAVVLLAAVEGKAPPVPLQSVLRALDTPTP